MLKQSVGFHDLSSLVSEENSGIAYAVHLKESSKIFRGTIVDVSIIVGIDEMSWNNITLRGLDKIDIRTFYKSSIAAIERYKLKPTNEDRVETIYIP